MAKLLLDSSIIVDYLRRKDKDQTILYKLIRDEAKNELYISIITHTECYAGKSIWESADVRKALEILLSGLKILSLDERNSEMAGKLKAQYNTNIADAIIAATSIIHNLYLVTLNTKDFEKIVDLRLFNK